MAADTLDVVTYDEAKTTVGVKAAGNSQLESYITAVSRRLDKACGGVVQRTVTSELHNGGARSIRLRHPASAFTSVIEYQGTAGITLTRETVGTAPGDGYLADPHEPAPSLFSGTLWRRAGGFDTCWWGGRRNVAVTYTGGRYADTAAVDDRFKEAALIMLRNLWATEEPSVGKLEEFDTPGGRFPRFAVPNAAKSLLFGEWREVPGLA